MGRKELQCSVNPVSVYTGSNRYWICLIFYIPPLKSSWSDVKFSWTIVGPRKCQSRRFAISIISSETQKKSGLLSGWSTCKNYTPPKKKQQLTKHHQTMRCVGPNQVTQPTPPPKKNGGRSNPRNGCVVGKVVPISTTVSSLVSSSTCSRHFWINLPLGGCNCHQCVRVLRINIWYMICSKYKYNMLSTHTVLFVFE